MIAENTGENDTASPAGDSPVQQRSLLDLLQRMRGAVDRMGAGNSHKAVMIEAAGALIDLAARLRTAEDVAKGDA